jgi:hypothetical protein
MDLNFSRLLHTFSCLLSEGAKGEAMEGSEVLGKDMMEQDEAEKGEKSEERRFKVGELVEFWEESFVSEGVQDRGR